MLISISTAVDRVAESDVLPAFARPFRFQVRPVPLPPDVFRFVPGRSSHSMQIGFFAR